MNKVMYDLERGLNAYKYKWSGTDPEPQFLRKEKSSEEEATTGLPTEDSSSSCVVALDTATLLRAGRSRLLGLLLVLKAGFGRLLLALLHLLHPWRSSSSLPASPVDVSVAKAFSPALGLALDWVEDAFWAASSFLTVRMASVRLAGCCRYSLSRTVSVTRTPFRNLSFASSVLVSASASWAVLFMVNRASSASVNSPYSMSSAKSSLSTAACGRLASSSIPTASQYSLKLCSHRLKFIVGMYLGGFESRGAARSALALRRAASASITPKPWGRRPHRLSSPKQTTPAQPIKTPPKGGGAAPAPKLARPQPTSPEHGAGARLGRGTRKARPAAKPCHARQPPNQPQTSQGALQGQVADERHAAGRIRGARVSPQAVDETPSARLSPPQHLLHRLWAVRLGSDDVACQLESPTAQQVAWTEQAGAATQSHVGHSLVADLESGAQQASVRRVSLLSASRSRRCTAGRSRSPPGTTPPSGGQGLGLQDRPQRTKGSPGKPTATPKILADAGNQTAEVDELLTTWKLSPVHQRLGTKSQLRWRPARRARRSSLTTRSTLVATTTSLSSCRWAPSTGEIVGVAKHAGPPLRLTSTQASPQQKAVDVGSKSGPQHPVKHQNEQANRNGARRRYGSSTGCNRDNSIRLSAARTEGSGAQLLKNCDDVRRGPFVGEE
uniref:Bromo domain-containing protein n=1 Tax=Macrostomum lignano TaxID=282301 RepID=A0A1I8J7M1_9PLAT